LTHGKSIGFICYPGCGLSLKKVGQGVLELLIGNKKVTTYICKAICPFFFERGHKNNNTNVNNIKIKFLLKG